MSYTRKLKNPLSVLILLTATAMPFAAKAVVIAIISAVIAIYGSYLHGVDAKNHDQLVATYTNTILNAISDTNRTIQAAMNQVDRLKFTTCDLYAHEVGQDFESFKINLQTYVARNRRALFINDLQKLQWYVTDIRKSFEDHKLLASCALDQFNTYPLYIAIANLDLNLQYEYISMIYKIAFLGNPDGTLNDISTLSPADQQLLLSLIEMDTQTAFKERVSDVLAHVKALDDSSGVISWRSKSDEQFSPVLGRYTQYTSDNYWYRFNGQDYEVFSGLLFGNRFVNIWEGCQGPNYNWTLASQGICKPTALPYFVQIKQDPAQFAYYANNPRDLYTRHKNDAYIEFAKNVFEPSIPILKSWVDLITDGSVSYPVLTVENDLATYVPF